MLLFWVVLRCWGGWGWGGRIIQALFQVLPDAPYGVRGRGHCRPYHLKLSCDNSGVMWWSISQYFKRLVSSICMAGLGRQCREALNGRICFVNLKEACNGPGSPWPGKNKRKNQSAINAHRLFGFCHHGIRSLVRKQTGNQRTSEEPPPLSKWNGYNVKRKVRTHTHKHIAEDCINIPQAHWIGRK